MVFSSISESDQPSAATVPMASIVSSVAKSHQQPLHNFSLTDLKWSPAHHRFRRHPVDSAHRSPLRDSPSRLDADDCRAPAIADQPPPRSTRTTVEASAANGRSSKILLRFRTREKPAEPAREAKAERETPAAQGEAPAEPEALTSKAWNLRPRKQITKKSSATQVVAEQDIRCPVEGARPRSGGSEAEAGAAAEERKVKLSVSVPLMKEEIEADFLAMTGFRPARRPKKRPRTVQRALDYSFPGLWLSNITLDSYKVVDNHHPKV